MKGSQPGWSQDSLGDKVVFLIKRVKGIDGFIYRIDLLIICYVISPDADSGKK